MKELEKSPRPYTQETNSKIEELQKIKHDLVRIIFITSEAMRFQCDEKSLEMYANFKNDKELTADEIKDLNKEKNKIEKEKTQLKTQLKNSIEKNVAKKSNIIQLIKNDNWEQTINEINNTELSSDDKQIINERIKEIEKFTEEIAEIKERIEIAELNKIIKESKNILNDVQKILQKNGKEVIWKDYTTQLRGNKEEFGGWKDYSETLNKFRIKIWKDLNKKIIILNFLSENNEKLNKIFKASLEQSQNWETNVKPEIKIIIKDYKEEKVINLETDILKYLENLFMCDKDEIKFLKTRDNNIGTSGVISFINTDRDYNLIRSIISEGNLDLFKLINAIKPEFIDINNNRLGT